MQWQLATWLDKTETPDGEHKITVVRDVDEGELASIRESIRVVHSYIVREPFVLVVQNHMEYTSFQEYVSERTSNDPLPLLQDDAQELGSGLRFRFLNWLLSFKAFLDLTQADLHRRFGSDSPESAAFERATREEFDGNFGYRLMARLRNFGQHSAFPPLEARIEVDADENGHSERTLKLFLDRDKLLEWDGWTVIRPELEGLGPEVPVAEQIESAMESLTCIAAAVKRIDLPALRDAAQRLNGLWDEAQGHPGVPLIGEFETAEENEEDASMRWQWIPKLDVHDTA